MAVLLWVVAALIVGSMIYMSALERTRDFAVFKAVGVSTSSVLGGLALQAVIIAVVAAAVGALLSLALAPLSRCVSTSPMGRSFCCRWWRSPSGSSPASRVCAAP